MPALPGVLLVNKVRAGKMPALPGVQVRPSILVDIHFGEQAG